MICNSTNCLPGCIWFSFQSPVCMCVGVCVWVCVWCVCVCVGVGVCVGHAIQQIAYVGVSGSVSSLLCDVCVCVCGCVYGVWVWVCGCVCVCVCVGHAIRLPGCI